MDILAIYGIIYQHFIILPACDCDPTGSEHGGECESRTDHANDLVAGRCICKRYVKGARCDQCTDGYWNMRADRSEGCERKYKQLLYIIQYYIQLFLLYKQRLLINNM